jgi:hypothetical protein
MCIHAGINDISWKKNFWCQQTRPRGRLYNHNYKTRIVVQFWSILASGDVWLCQQHLEMTLPALTSNLTWPQATVRKYKTSTIVVGFWPRVEWHRCRGLPLLANGYSWDLIWSRVQEICFFKVDECLWNSERNWLEGTDYFEFLIEIWYEDSRNFEYQMRRHLPRVCKEYLCVPRW